MQKISTMQKIYMIDTVEQFKVIMDPIRVKILKLFVFGVNELTGKQVAMQMGEVPSKIYYHIRELEKVGALIESRTAVKGHLIEKYYQKAFHSVAFGSKLTEELRSIPSSESQNITSKHLLAMVSYIRDSVSNYVNGCEEMEASNQDEDEKEVLTLSCYTKIACTHDEFEQYAKDVLKLNAKYKHEDLVGRKSYEVYSLAFRELNTAK